MMIPALFAVLLSGPVTIYVGPVVKDGFVETDKGVQDSISDVRAALAKTNGLRVVAREEGADLKLYVTGRTKVDASGSTTTGTVVGGSVVVMSEGKALYRVESILRAGTYERQFAGESEPYVSGTWARCAKLLARDLGVWLEANRERVASR